MARELRLELSETASRRLRGLQDRLHEKRPEGAIYMALGLLQMVLEYVDDDGVLTVVDPRLLRDHDADPNVPLVFENLQPMRAKPALNS